MMEPYLSCSVQSCDRPLALEISHRLGTMFPMLLPQFSLRKLLLMVTGSAGVAGLLSLAMRGHLWAAGAFLCVIAILMVLVVQAACFGLLWVVSSITDRRHSASRQDRLPSPVSGVNRERA